MSRIQVSAASQAAMLSRAFQLRNRALRAWKMAFTVGADRAAIVAAQDALLDAERNLQATQVRARALRLMAAVS
jgi:hypothetical protein